MSSVRPCKKRFRENLRPFYQSVKVWTRPLQGRKVIRWGDFLRRIVDWITFSSNVLNEQAGSHEHLAPQRPCQGSQKSTDSLDTKDVRIDGHGNPQLSKPEAAAHWRQVLIHQALPTILRR